MIKTIILDFDGVIVESVDIKHHAFRNLLPEYPEFQEQIMAYHLANNAISRYVKFKYIVENILGQQYDSHYEQRLNERFNSFTREQIIKCPFVPGAPEFLPYFSDKLPLYLVSATPLQELKIILEARQLLPYFKRVYEAPTQKGDIIKEILSKEKFSPDEAIYIGDSREDYEAAREAGVIFAARVSGFNFDNLDVPKFDNLIEIQKFIVEYGHSEI